MRLENQCKTLMVKENEQTKPSQKPLQKNF